MAENSVALAWLASGLILAAACGSDAEDLFGNTTQDDAADTTGAGNASSTTSGMGASGNDGSGAIGSGASGNVPSSGGAGRGGSASGGAPSTTSTGGAPTTSSGGSPGDSLDCGNADCPVARDSACCWDNYEQNPPPKAECVSTATDACNNTVSQSGLETIIECQLPSHCKTGVCCAEREFFTSGGQSMSFYSELSCQDSCAWPDILVCDPQAPMCPVSTTCVQSQLLPPGYFICAG
jgi:hypothetical protein